MPSHERRASPRTRISTRVLILDPEDVLQEPYVGWAVDRSVGGICLAFQRVGLKRGDLFFVSSMLQQANRRWSAVRVKNDRWRNNRLEVGCEFVPLAVLRADLLPSPS